MRLNDRLVYAIALNECVFHKSYQDDLLKDENYLFTLI